MAISDLPTGTVTFLYTDIEGSTRLWEEQPTAMREAVARHEGLLRAAIDAHHGHVFRTAGDGVCAAFATAPEALAAALAAQQALQAERWGATGPLRPRMALHAGAAAVSSGDYVGSCLNRVARLLTVGHGGQTLLSQATADLARGALPDGASLRDLGEHRLRDLSQAERVYQLCHADLPLDFAPLRSLNASSHNFPVQLTTFVGREKEIAEVTDLLRSAPLLTLTGTGGCGKTRLALQVAADLVSAYPDGAWLVELGPLADPSLVGPTVASVLDVHGPANRPIDAVLVDALRTKRLLLVLDNCEHLIDACARLADVLLRNCPGVQILATSREALGIAGEVSWRVPSLAVPVADATIPVEELGRNECMRLLTERARAVLPGFTLNNRNAPALAQICRRLDGIPLALELAAARLKGLSADQLASRLDQRFRLLTGGSRAALPRQHTLAAMVGWSYDLLTEPERTLFNRLAVFAGGFTLEAAEEVCSERVGDQGAGSPPPLIPAEDVLDLLLRLVDKSLVVAEPSDEGADRYRLLETLRQFGLEKLAVSGEADGTRARHAAHYFAMAEQAGAQFWGPRFAFWYARVRLELNNVRAALRWAIAARDVEQALMVSGQLSDVLYITGQPAESRRSLEELLASPAAARPTVGRGRALHAAGQLAHDQFDLDRADAYFDEALEILRERGDQEWIVWSLAGKVWVAVAGRNYVLARTLGEEAIAIGRATKDPRIVAGARFQLSQPCFYLADYATAQACAQEFLDFSRRERAPYECPMLDWLGHIATAAGDYTSARARYRESMRLRLTIDRKIGIAYTLSGFAGLAAAQGDLPRAVRLSGAAARLCELFGVPAHRSQEGYIRDRLPGIRDALGPATYDAAWEEGHAMSHEEAVACALEEDGT